MTKDEFIKKFHYLVGYKKQKRDDEFRMYNPEDDRSYGSRDRGFDHQRDYHGRGDDYNRFGSQDRSRQLSGSQGFGMDRSSTFRRAAKQRFKSSELRVIDKINKQIANYIIMKLKTDPTARVEYIFDNITDYKTNSFDLYQFKDWMREQGIHMTNKEE